jgi:protein-tyrosine phosphatase
MITCILPGRLFASPRPGRYSKGIDSTDVPASTVDLWIRAAQTLGVQRVLCLLDAEQLDYYRQLPGGLLPYYQRNGLEVTHLPTADHRPVSDRTLIDALKWFAEDDRAALVHCSAGIERTGAVIQYIIKHS